LKLVLNFNIRAATVLYFNGEGSTVAVVNKRLSSDKGGYTVIYNAPTLPGMSGGGVFNKAGQLVAIHGVGDQYTANTGVERQISGSSGIANRPIGSKISYNRGIPTLREVY
jgi:hypothetical protein